GAHLRAGHGGSLLQFDRHDEDVIWAESTVFGRLELVEVRILPAHVVGEAERGEVEVEAPRAGIAVVVEAVDDARRYDEKRPCRKTPRAVPEVERELAFYDEETVRVLAMDVRLRTTLAGAVVELRDRDVAGFAEHGCPTRWSVRDGVSVRASGSTDDDVLVAGNGVRDVDVESLRFHVAQGRYGIRNAGRDVDPGVPLGRVFLVLGLHHERAAEDVQRLSVRRVAFGLPRVEHPTAA